MTRRHAASAPRTARRHNWWLLAAAGVLSLPGRPSTQESFARIAPAEPAAWAANDGFSPPPPPATKISPGTDASGQANARAALEKLPLYFIENRGQADPRVAYYLQGGTTGVYFTREGITFTLTGSAAETNKRWALKLDFVGANPDVKPIGRDKTAAVVSYFKGKPEKWQTGLPTYDAVVYEDLWPGIDLVYSGTASRVKYTFIVEPGADPNLIQLAYRGAASVRVTEDGRLAVETPAGRLDDDAPYAYQEIDGKQVDVSARFALEAKTTEATYRYGFRVGAYDRSKPLILDPVILSYCGYIGGLSTDNGQGAAVDSGGNLYAVGYTSSTDPTFPETTGPYLTNGGSFDAFVAKVNPSGTALIYCGYIGGSTDDNAFAVAVDSAGNAYVVGRATSTEATFPVSVGPSLTYGGGADDAFVAKVNVAGTALVYCGYIGGSDSEGAMGVAVDSSGNAYVAGSTGSRPSSFPEIVGPVLSYGGGSKDAFVAKVNVAGSALVYCGYIGGGSEDLGSGIAVDASGNAYVAGSALSDEAKFPVTGGPDITFNGGVYDAFVAKVNPGGTALVYCGYIGGSGNDSGYGIAVDASGSAYVSGSTTSTPLTFPVTVGPDLTQNGVVDAFVAKVSPSGLTLTYCGYIGGSGLDAAYGIALDSSGNAYVAGETDSDQASFPVTGGPSSTFGGGFHDAFVAKVNASGTALSYAGYIGGTGDEFGRAIAVLASGGYAYVVGETDSTEASFPVKTGPDLIQNGAYDAFVARIEDTSLTTFTCRKPITIDRTKVGDGSTTTLSNFPMLFSVTDPNLRTTANGGNVNNANGYDIMFRAFGSTTCGGPSVCNLDFEVEKYVATTGELLAWVRLPSVNGQAAGSNTTLYVYYGNTSITSPWENPAGVWNSSYAGVWHLKEDPSGTAPQMKDSTSNANHATSGSGMTSGDQVAGQVDGSLDFDGTINDTINMADSASLDLTSIGMIEAWVYIRSFPVNNYGTLLEKYAGAGPGYQVLPHGANRDVWLGLADGVGESVVVSDPNLFSYNTWEHLVVIWDGTNVKFYKNGAQFGASQAQPRNAAVNALSVMVGRDRGLDGYWDGIIDELRISNTARPAAWIATEHNNQNSPSTFYTVGAAQCSPATAVELSSFTATGYDGHVLVEWTTGSELKNLGFHLYRATSEEGPYARITASAIPGLGSSPVGASYRYVDSGLTNGMTYFYKLEDIETMGETELHGPVTATPSPESPMPGALAGSSSGACLTYGDPSQVSLRILERSENQMVLELRTGGFYAEPRPDGSVEMTIPGFVTESEPGAASIPVWRSWLDVVAGRSVRIASVSTEEVEVFSSLKPSLAEPSEIVASPQGVVRLARRPRSDVSSTRGVQPEKVARIVTTGYQADVKKALVELAPLRWSGRGISLARRLTVTLVFSGLDDLESHRESPSHQRPSVVRRLVTQERGLYGASFEEVMGSRREAVETTSLRLSRQGQPVAFHVEPDNGVFAPGSTFYFLSEGSSLNPYGREAVYELERGQGLMMPVDSVFASGPSVGFYWQRLVREENRYYQAGLLEAEDLWLWDLFFAPARKAYSFALPDLASTSESSHLQVGLQGVSDFPEELDHHVRVYVNGTLVAEASFDGKKGEQLTADILPGVLREGMNQLEIENVGDTGAPYSMVMLDRYEISYPRMLRPLEPTLEGSFSASGVVESGQRLVLDITEPVPRWLNVFGSSLRVEAGREYLAVSPTTVLRPRVEARQASRLKSRLNRADYVVVGPKAFLDAALPLLNRRRSQGLRTQAVPVEEVFSEFGFGETSPRAIRDFLSYAYHHWRQPSPKYVLLLGDGTYDFKDYLGTGVQNQVPPLLVKTSFLWTASDPAYASVNGEDLLPDLAIGRLPAESVGEVRVMVKKILNYEASGSLSKGPVVLVADNPDDAGNFVENAEALAGGVLVSRYPTKVYLSELGRDATRAAIVDAFDRGASLLSYIGHGGIHLWASENVFDDAEVSALAPQSQQPVVLTLNCLNGYFHFPYFNSLAEELVKADGDGAIAAFSPSGLSLNGPAHLFHERLLRALVSGEHRRLGDAVVSAQAAYAATGAFPELLRIYQLLGDPALHLR